MKKKLITLNEAEWLLVLNAINKLRTSLIDEGRHTDVVDEIMIKLVNAPVKMAKTA